MYSVEVFESPEVLRPFRCFEKECGPMPPAYSWLESGHIGMVAYGPEGPVGVILLVPCRQIGNKVTKYSMSWLMVLPDYRKRGIGKQLLKAAADEANLRGASTIQIAIKPENQPGISWSQSIPRIPGLGIVVSLDRYGGF